MPARTHEFGGSEKQRDCRDCRDDANGHNGVVGTHHGTANGTVGTEPTWAGPSQQSANAGGAEPRHSHAWRRFQKAGHQRRRFSARCFHLARTSSKRCVNASRFVNVPPCSTTSLAHSPKKLITSTHSSENLLMSSSVHSWNPSRPAYLRDGSDPCSPAGLPCSIVFLRTARLIACSANFSSCSLPCTMRSKCCIIGKAVMSKLEAENPGSLWSIKWTTPCSTSPKLKTASPKASRYSFDGYVSPGSLVIAINSAIKPTRHHIAAGRRQKGGMPRNDRP